MLQSWLVEAASSVACSVRRGHHGLLLRGLKRQHCIIRFEFQGMIFEEQVANRGNVWAANKHHSRVSAGNASILGTKRFDKVGVLQPLFILTVCGYRQVSKDEGGSSLTR